MPSIYVLTHPSATKATPAPPASKPIKPTAPTKAQRDNKILHPILHGAISRRIPGRAIGRIRARVRARASRRSLRIHSSLLRGSRNRVGLNLRVSRRRRRRRIRIRCRGRRVRIRGFRSDERSLNGWRRITKSFRKGLHSNHVENRITPTREHGLEVFEKPAIVWPPVSSTPILIAPYAQ